MRKLIPLLILAIAGSVHSTTTPADDCHGPNAPSEFPEPSTATEQDIITAQQAVKKYLSDMESALKCMDALHNERARDMAIDDMQKIASKFNTVLRAFRARQKA